MSKITGIIQQKRDKTRYNLFIDEQFFCGVTLESIYKYNLKVDKEIDKDQLGNILHAEEKSCALAKTTNYISKSQKTKKQIRTYLLGKGFSEEVCFYCIDKLSDYGYIDDVEYSRKYIESVKKTHGKRLSDYKLMMKGVRKEDIEKAREDQVDTEKEDAINLARKHIKNKQITKENLAKTYRYLIGRGFSYENAENAVSKIKEEF